MSAALAVLTGVLVVLGNLSLGAIVTGLVALAGMFVILGAAGLLLGPIAPALLLLGAAIIVIGAGVASEPACWSSPPDSPQWA